MEKNCIRGINFQPITFSGRVNKHDIKNRITMTGVLEEIEKQTKEKIKKQVQEFGQSKRDGTGARSGG